MESILSLFVFHDTYVVSFLVIGITIIVVMLLLFNTKSPSSVVRSEVEGPDEIEGALRRVLGEKKWETTSSAGEGVEVEELQKEVLEKDRKIAELNKQITQSGGNEEGGQGGAGGDNSDLLAKITELEGRLMEYEIIEDDIADLSLFKSENEKLKEELARLKALAGEDKVVEEEVSDAPEAEPVAQEEPEPEPVEEESPVEEPVEEPKPKEPGEKVKPADLVAEFEKVVNSQADGDDEEDENLGSVMARGDDLKGSDVSEGDQSGGGTVMVDGESGSSGEVSTVKEELGIHPKLRDVDPDSKEEAEVFISELKSLKKGTS